MNTWLLRIILASLICVVITISIPKNSIIFLFALLLSILLVSTSFLLFYLRYKENFTS